MILLSHILNLFFYINLLLWLDKLSIKCCGRFGLWPSLSDGFIDMLILWYPQQLEICFSGTNKNSCHYWDWGERYISKYRVFQNSCHENKLSKDFIFEIKRVTMTQLQKYIVFSFSLKIILFSWCVTMLNIILSLFTQYQWSWQWSYFRMSD